MTVDAFKDTGMRPRVDKRWRTSAAFWHLAIAKSVVAGVREIWRRGKERKEGIMDTIAIMRSGRTVSCGCVKHLSPSHVSEDYLCLMAVSVDMTSPRREAEDIVSSRLDGCTPHEFNMKARSHHPRSQDFLVYVSAFTRVLFRVRQHPDVNELCCALTPHKDRL